MTFALGAWTTGLAVVGLLVAEWLGSTRGKWLFKPVASTGFLVAAVGAGALASGWGTLVVGGLVACWVGDVLLIPAATGAFLAGIGSFLLGHLAFAGAFAIRGFTPLATAAGLAVLAIVARAVLAWLRPNLHGFMRKAVPAYVAAITLMVALALGTHVLHSNAALLVGAIAFFGSDLSVARDRFVRSSFVNRLWGLPLYYAAQLLLAAAAGQG